MKRFNLYVKYLKEAEDKKWIQKAVEKPGALHRALGVPAGEKIPKEKLKVKSSDTAKMKKRKILAQTLSKLRKHHENVNLDNYYVLEDVDVDAADENEMVNGGEPKNLEASKDDLVDEILEELQLSECECENASEYNEITNGEEPDDIDDTMDDIEDELSEL